VSRRASPRLVVYAALCALGLVAALAARRPEPVALAAAFALVLAVAALADRDPRVHAWIEVSRERALEGEEIEVALTIRADSRAEQVEALLVVPDGLELVEGKNPVSLQLGEGDDETLPLRLLATHWGAYALGDLRLRASDPLALWTHEWRVARPHHLQIYPRPEALRELVAPLRTNQAIGNTVARAKGDGLEFADVRKFVPGDRVRSVNWRASARRAELIVNERHPERSGDIVLFLDTFAEVRKLDESSLDSAIRATATLADHYLAHRDRVGLVAFGGTLRWLTPGSGLRQRYLLVEALLATELQFSYAWKNVDVIPSRTMPPGSLVIAVTPLLDPRAIAALLDLRARRHDLAVVEVSPLAIVEPGSEPHEQLAYRLWRLRRDELVTRLERHGIAVARWSGGSPLGAAIEEVRSFRRHAQLVRR
jgi:uncharacterized protein (DUF58 family)